MPNGALAGYRVLDLTGEQGWMCGKVLADLGANVIKIEPPDGDPGRWRGPFYQDVADVEHGLPWWAYNTSKRSLCLDYTGERGQQVLRRLAREADFIIESFAPGYLDDLQLGYPVLHRINPRLIVTSITPFGQSGPYRDWLGPDIVGMAMGGFMELTGETDGRPARITLPQAALHAGMEAAVASLLAHFERLRSDVGQHVDVSIQACIVWTLMAAPGFVPCQLPAPQRNGPSYNWVGYPRRLNFPCRDGHVSMFLVGDVWGGPAMQGLTDLMHADGMAPDFMRQKDWLNWHVSDLLGSHGQAESDRIDAAVMAYTQTKTKHELYAAALTKRLLLAPVSNVRDLCDNAQLQARQFFVPVDHASSGQRFLYPGAFAKFSVTPCLPPRRAPLLGEHSRQVLRELLRLDTTTIDSLVEDGTVTCQPSSSVAETPRAPRPLPPAPTPHEAVALPLSGIRIIDFTWIAVGPVTTKYLADHGAEVIRIESWAHPDGLRYGPPHMQGIVGENRSYFFATCNTSKYSVTLNLNRPEGRDLARRLIATADVVTESFTPQVMQRWELDYQHLRQLKPDLIMLSTCMQGQNGPHALYPGFGNLMAGLLGFYELTGWPDGEACAIYGAYTDFVAPRFAALSLLAALEYRRRTGKGQYIDLAQSEASLHFLAPALLDYTVNGRVMQRQGNRDAHMAPHGAYRCQGDNRWCVLAVANDDEWGRLCQVAEHPQWQKNSRYRTPAARQRNAEALDALIESWTITQEAADLVRRLQAAGVAAGVVQNIHDLRHDPQLQHRNFWVELEHSEIGPLALEGHQFLLSTRHNRPRFPRPAVGEHNAVVLGSILGLSAEEISRLEAEEVIY